MTVNRMPFTLVLLSSLMPVIGAFFGFSVFHFPAALVLFVGIIVYSSTRSPVYLSRIWLISLILLFAILSVQVLSDRGFVILAAGGYVVIFGFIFYGLFSIDRGITIVSAFNGVSALSKFFLIGMLVELVIVLAGGQGLLHDLFGKTSSGGYKTYNPADILRLAGFFKAQGGLNSILLGSQIAGMLSLFATIWFTTIRNIQRRKSRSTSIWLGISIFMLLITINGTGLFLAVSAAIMYALFARKLTDIRWILAGIALLGGLYLLVSAGYVLPRIFADEQVRLPVEQRIELENRGFYDRINGTTLNYYISEFSDPLKIYMDAAWVDKALGVGAGYLRTTNQYVGGDFALAAGLLAGGAVWTATMIIVFVWIGVDAMRVPRSTSYEMRQWSHLSFASGMITILWLMSGVHYNQAFSNPGGVAFFASSLALAAYSRRRLRGYASIGSDQARSTDDNSRQRNRVS